jgi:hypothetical protein
VFCFFGKRNSSVSVKRLACECFHFIPNKKINYISDNIMPVLSCQGGMLS